MILELLKKMQAIFCVKVNKGILDKEVREELGEGRRYVARPLRPKDFGKENWVWKNGETFQPKNIEEMVITGIWSNSLVEARLQRAHAIIAILATRSPLYEYVHIRQNVLITIRCRNSGAPTEEKVEFAILGLAIEYRGKVIA